MEAAQRGTTLSRAPNGDALAFPSHVELERLASTQDYTRGLVMLESVLCRPRSERRAADFDTWAFVLSLSEEQLLEFHNDMSDALMRTCSRVDTVRPLLDAWRATAESMADETAMTTLREDLENFTEIQRPKDTKA